MRCAVCSSRRRRTTGRCSCFAMSMRASSRVRRRCGAKRATALALAPDLVLGQADAARDALALQTVGHAALAFTPMVCIESTDSAGTPTPVVLLEVQSSLRCFGGLSELLDRLHHA